MNATINELLFPVFLFAVYFCAVSTLMYRTNNLTTTYQEVPETSSQSNSIPPVDDFLINLTESTEEGYPLVENESLSFEPDIPEVQKEEITDSEPQNNIYIQTEAIINNLNKRQSRQICRPLGIQQKSGKIDKSLTLIKAELHSLFQENPDKVISVIQEKLPELMLTINHSIKVA